MGKELKKIKSATGKIVGLKKEIWVNKLIELNSLTRPIQNQESLKQFSTSGSWLRFQLEQWSLDYEMKRT